MFVNKILKKSLRPLFCAKNTRRAFFANDKTAETPAPSDTEVLASTENTVKDILNAKLAEFGEDELKGTRLTHKTLLKSIEPYKTNNAKVFDRLSAEIESLFKERDSIPSLRTEIKSLDEVNKVNHDKLVKAVDRIKSAEQETLDIEARLSKEIEKSKTYAISKFSSEVLEILDNLELCMDNVNKNKEKNAELLASDFYQGIDLTYKHALGIFRRFGITQIEEGVGQQMDVNVHDVLFVARDESKPEGEIIHVAKRGYRLGDRVLRAAKVGVVRNE